MSLGTFDILSEFRALEALLNEVDAETGEFLNSEDDIKEYVINLRLSKEQKLNNIEKAWENRALLQEETTIFDAYKQLTVRYQRDIPELFKYNAFCVISDGVNTKAGSFFAKYDFFYAWRKTEGMPNEVDGIDAMFTMIQGMFNRERFRNIIQNFIFLPDSK